MGPASRMPDQDETPPQEGLSKKGLAKKGLNRRTLLIGGGAGIGLVLAWGLWPRTYKPNLVASEGETIINAFLKISADGSVSVVVPQAEMGQGVWTGLPQILADELGADWRTIAVEPAPISPLYVNDFLAREMVQGLPSLVQGVGDWTATQIAQRMKLMVTGGSSSIRGFDDKFRQAGATARALLCMAAAKRWNIDWEACDTEDGFVINGDRRLRFAELAADAAKFDPPGELTLRAGKLRGESVPRIDLPAKVDGSARYAADVRLPDMVYASVRQRPAGAGELLKINEQAARKVPGVIATVRNPQWVAAVATNWWAAERGAERLQPTYAARELANSNDIEQLLADTIEKGEGERIVDNGDTDSILKSEATFTADFSVPMAAHAPMETMCATARLTGDQIEVWLPTQAPAFSRASIARLTGYAESQVMIYPMLIGGSFGRKAEIEAAEMAAIMTIKLQRPVQVVWSRAEDIRHDTYRPPARAILKSRLANNGAPMAWSAVIATPSFIPESLSRLKPGMGDPAKADKGSVEGAVPAYMMESMSVEHRPVVTGVKSGAWRSVAHSYTAFFNECFVDELAGEAGIEPFSYRMMMMGNSPRLAACLSAVTTLGNWQGGTSGSGQGIAAHSCFGSHIALLADVKMADGGAVRVTKIHAVVDCGEVIHPDIVRQQVEGGIIFGMAAALGGDITIDGGLAEQTNFDGLALPILADSPEIVIELIESKEKAGGIGEVAVPPVAPAIANALFTLTGNRLRSLPLRPAVALPKSDETVPADKAPPADKTVPETPEKKPATT